MAKSNTTKYLLIAGVVAVGYYLYTQGSGSSLSSAVSAITAAGNAARAQLAMIVTGNPVYDSITEGLTDAQANALLAWNNAGRPGTYVSDPVLAPVLQAYKNQGFYV